MSIVKEDGCVRCETCHQCGNKRLRVYLYCDECGRNEDERYLEVGEFHFCENCYIKKLEHKVIDIDGGEEDLYCMDGEWRTEEEAREIFREDAKWAEELLET